jgi:hypothetical protein
MIVAVYVIGSAGGLIALAVRLRAMREELDRVRRERDTYVRAIQASPLAAAAARELAARPVEGPVGGAAW